MSDDKENVDAKKLPTDQKLTHKNWSVRKMGYEECIKLFKSDDPNDPDFQIYLDLIKNFTNDTNEAARDKALEAVIVYLEFAGIASKCVPDMLVGIFSKCITGKSTSRDKAVKILEMCVEMDQHTVVQEKLVEGIASKQPKIVQTSLEVLRKIISEFGGPKVIQFKPVIKELASAIEHRDKAVRDEAKLLAIEMYKWNSKQFMKDLREAETKLQDKVIESLENELEEAKKTSEKPVQKKYRRSEGKAKAEEEKKQEELKAKAEAEKRAKEEAERKEEEKRKKQKEAEVEAERARLEAEKKIKQEEEERKARIEAEKRAKLEEELRKEALQKLKAETEEKEKLEAKLKSEAEELARKEEALLAAQPAKVVVPEKKRDLKSIITNSETLQKLKNETKATGDLVNINNNRNDIDKALLNCIIRDNRPISDFHKPGMLKFLQTIMPGYKPPTRSVLVKRLDQIKQENDKELTKIFKDISDIALSAEFFKNSRNSYYLCIRVHYFDKKFQYKSNVLSFKRFIQSKHLQVKINSYIKYEIKRFNITAKIRTVTTNNSISIKEAAENNDFGTRISCLVDNLDSTIIEALFLDEDLSSGRLHECDKDYRDDEHYLSDEEAEDESESEKLEIHDLDEEDEMEDSSDFEQMETKTYNPDEVTAEAMSHLINKVRKTIRLILNSKILTEFVLNEAQKEDIKLKLILDLPLRWHTTFVMIDRFIKYISIIESIMSSKNPPISHKRFEALRHLKLSKNEWILLKSLVEVLQPFSKAVILISSRDYHPLSLSQVIISSLKRFLSEKTINVHVNSIKEIIYNRFKDYFEKNIDAKERSLRLMATYLNPLHFRCLNESERHEAEQLLIKEESEMSKKFSIFSIAKTVLDSSIKIKKQESFDIFKDFIQETGPESLNQLSNSENSNLTFKEEMAYYVASLKRNSVFDDFWNQERLSLPHLYALVKRISVTPISCTDTRNSFTSSSYIQRKKLANLNPKDLHYSFALKDTTN